MIVQGAVGPVPYADKSQATFRLGNQGDVITSRLHGGRYMASREKRVFHQVANSNLTVSSAYTIATALGSSPQLIVGIAMVDFGPAYNVNAVIHQVRVDTVSGTPGSSLQYVYLPWDNINNQGGGSNLGPLPGYLTELQSTTAGSAAVPSKARPRGSTALVGVTGDTRALVKHSMVGGVGNTSSGVKTNSIYDQVDGRIIVPPGYVFGVMATDIGTTWVIRYSMVWQEVPTIVNR